MDAWTQAIGWRRPEGGAWVEAGRRGIVEEGLGDISYTINNKIC